jgi:Fur family ferric uptake transcriptional regulator
MNASQKHLKEAGLKSTHSRRKILDILEQSELRHLTAEDIYQHAKNDDASISLATVYRVLTQFEEAKLVLKHTFESGSAVYELSSGSHHDHMVCLECGNVQEFMDDLIEIRQQQVAKKAGFTLCDHNLTMYGLCQKCRPTK